MGFFLTTFRTGHETAFWTKYKIILTVPLLNNTDFFFCPKKILIYSKQTVFVYPEHYIRITSFSLIINFTSYSCALGVCFYFVLVWGFLCMEVLFATCWMILIGCYLGYYSFKIYKLNTNQQITFIIFIFDNINSILVLFFKLSLKITLFTVIHKACIVPSQKWEKKVKKR